MRSRSLDRACVLCVRSISRTRLLSTTSSNFDQLPSTSSSRYYPSNTQDTSSLPSQSSRKTLPPSKYTRTQPQPPPVQPFQDRPLPERTPNSRFKLSRVPTGDQTAASASESTPEWNTEALPAPQLQRPRCTSCGRVGHHASTCVINPQDNKNNPQGGFRIRMSMTGKGNWEERSTQAWNLQGSGRKSARPGRARVPSKPRVEQEVVNLFKSDEDRKTWAAGRLRDVPSWGQGRSQNAAGDLENSKKSPSMEINFQKTDRNSRASRFANRDHIQSPKSPSNSRLRMRLDQIEDRQKDRRRGTGFENKSRDRNFADNEIFSGDPRKKSRQKPKAEARRNSASAGPPEIRLPTHISVSNLATILRYRLKPFANRLVSLGFPELQYNHVLTAEDAALIAMEFGFQPVIEHTSKNLVAAPWPVDMSSLPLRPPVVTIMGHVDHGKTTILDYLRNSSIVAQEAGGITQHIGAFSVSLKSTGRTITFLDTPGHAAFLNMRERGANVTDIIVLVVAADDGVMPQTIEAIKHAKAAKVPIIVAISKIDRPEANVERAKQAVARHGVEVEDYGGDTQVVCVSGKTGQGIPDLEDSIITLSEILDHRSPVDGKVEGWILESRTTEESGRVATVLVRRGTLKLGDILVAGRTWARVRTLRNEFGTSIDSAPPGTPVSVDGWRGTPSPGDECLQAEDEQEASSVVKTREDLEAQVKLAADMQVVNERRKEHSRIRAEELKGLTKLEITQRQRRLGMIEGAFLDDTIKNTKDDTENEHVKTINFVVKADVIGSVEAVVNLISGLGNSNVNVNVVRATTGPLCKADIDMASASNSTILAFNAEVSADSKRLADESGVEVWEHDVIYRIPEDVTKKLESLLPQLVTQRVTGEAEVAATFSLSVKTSGSGSKATKKTVAGCKVRNGMVRKGSRVKVTRNGEIIYDGTISSLKSEKKDVAEMKKDTECGMAFDDWEGFEVGDKIQTYTETREERKLG